MFNLSSLMFIDAAQITLIIVVAALLILYPVFMYVRNKKDREKRNELYETIRKGDYVITYSGIMGKVVEIFEKQNGKFLTIQTGEGKNSGFVCITIDAVYSFTDNKDKIFGTDGEPVNENNSNVSDEKNKDVTSKEDKKTKKNKVVDAVELNTENVSQEVDSNEVNETKQSQIENNEVKNKKKKA